MGFSSDKRSGKRELFNTTIDYAYLKCEGERAEYDTCSAVTSNLSSGGVGIFTSIPLAVGSEIEIISARIEGCPCSALVRWATCLTPNLYRAGVMFN